MTQTKSKHDSLQEAEAMLNLIYDQFNARNINRVLEKMQEAVDWPNAIEGRIEHGHEAVRAYWTRQWTMIDPKVYPVVFNLLEDGRIDVTVRQVVHDLAGNLLSDQTVHHLYTLDDGLIKSMEIR